MSIPTSLNLSLVPDLESLTPSSLSIYVSVCMEKALGMLPWGKFFVADKIFTEILDFLDRVIEYACRCNDGELEKCARSLQNSIACSSEFILLRKKVKETLAMMKHFDPSAENWTLLSDADGVKSYYREEKEHGTHSFKVEGLVDSPIAAVAAVLYEVDLYRTWFPLCVASENVCTLSLFRKLCRFQTWTLWPLSNREVFLDGYGVDCTEENSFLIFVRSVPEEITTELVDKFRDEKMDEKFAPEIELLCREYATLGVKTIPKENEPFVSNPSLSSFVRIIIHMCGFLIKPISADETFLQITFNVDPKLPFVSYAILNWFSSKIVHYILIMMRKVSKFGPDSEHAKQIQANPTFYDHIKGLIDKLNLAK